jgi:catechol 2,3-dioxygenase
MHLQVSDVRRARDFYSDAVGFDTMMMLGPSAAFVSAGGYHHHIGMNTWNSAGAPPPPPDSIGLQYFVTRLPNVDELGRVIDRLHAAGVPIEEQDEGVLVRDPSHNGMLLTADSARA